MDTVNEIKQRLSAESRIATLDELRNQGRKKVRLIRAEQIAEMLSQAVHAAIEGSGLTDSDEHERLVEKSRKEFEAIVAERKEDARKASDVEGRLADTERELEDARERFSQLTVTLAEARTELDQTADGSDGLRDELEQAKADAERARGEAEAARAGAEQARVDAEQARAGAEEAKNTASAAPAAEAPPNELLMSLFQEMMTMKASIQQQAAAPAAPAGGTDLGAAMDKLTSSLNDRLETLGKKLGVSSAVESDEPVDFSAMFKDTGETIESNMADVKLKQKSGGGIAGNLARLKKLKGGG